MLNDEYQSMAANAICHAAAMAGQVWQDAAYQTMLPSVIYRPALSQDGGKWCALYGANLQEGVAGFGDTPAEAMRDFDNHWTSERPAPRR
jgi:hypothetical protein